MEYLHKIDPAVFDLRDNTRLLQRVLDREKGKNNCEVLCIRTESGGGSPRGLHTHMFDQIFYVISGSINFEINGQQSSAEAGSVIVFPAGIPHRNWNSSQGPSVHLSIHVSPSD
jgi:quercetin dioxygenase-like cupin family protein